MPAARPAHGAGGAASLPSMADSISFARGAPSLDIVDVEGLKDAPISANFETIEKIRRAFERAGVEFLGYPYPGVRLRLVEDQKGSPA